MHNFPDCVDLSPGCDDLRKVQKVIWAGKVKKSIEQMRADAQKQSQSVANELLLPTLQANQSWRGITLSPDKNCIVVERKSHGLYN